jgi:hypothetical protein
VTNLCNGTHQNRETKSLQLGLHHFNPPPNESSYKGDNEVIHHKEGRGLHTFKDKGMQTQYEVKFLQSVFDLKVELFSSFPSLEYGSIYSLHMELKGRVEAFLAYGRSRIMDCMTQHGNPT